MRPSGWLFLTRLSICCALAASAVLYVHYLSPLDSGFCGPSSGCEAARRSGIGYFGSRYVSLPLLAILAFGALLGLSLRRSPGATLERASGLGLIWREPSVTLFAASGLGALVAAGLIAYQGLVLEDYCWLCLIVDGSAIAAAVFAFFAARAARRGLAVGPGPLHGWAWMALAALLVLAPLVWDAVKPVPPIPNAIAALYEPGKINIVEFADFECPYCRRLHALVKPLLAEYGEAVHLVRAHRPLMQHANAAHAARAAICAEAQGKGEAMANALFEVTLSPEAIPRVAEGLLLDPVRFDLCLQSAETTAVLERDAALLPDSELRGLPTTYVGNKQFVGVPTEAALRDAFERARKPPLPTLSGPVFLGVLALALGLVGLAGRRRGHEAGP
jgi:protein-disulfide isomerase